MKHAAFILSLLVAACTPPEHAGARSLTSDEIHTLLVGNALLTRHEGKDYYYYVDPTGSLIAVEDHFARADQRWWTLDDQFCAESGDVIVCQSVRVDGDAVIMKGVRFGEMSEMLPGDQLPK